MPPRVCAFFEHEDAVHAGGGESVNLNFSHDTASRYVGLYRNRENPKLLNVRNLAEAYYMLWRNEPETNRFYGSTATLTQLLTRSVTGPASARAKTILVIKPKDNSTCTEV